MFLIVNITEDINEHAVKCMNKLLVEKLTRSEMEAMIV